MADKDTKEIVCYVPFGSTDETIDLMVAFQQKAAEEGVSVKIERGDPPRQQCSPGIH